MPPKKEMAREQMILIASRGYLPSEYEVIVDYPRSMLIRKKDGTEPAVIFKEGPDEDLPDRRK